MPELPDIEAYRHALSKHCVGHRLKELELISPFVLRTVEPSYKELAGKQIHATRRIGKRIVFEFPEDIFAIVHLMIAGRFQWRKADAKLGRNLAAFRFEHGTLLLTEASKKKRASIHIVRGESALAEHDRGGLEVLGLSLSDFRDQLTKKNHTVKRALTDQRIFSGIGNAYSDEILHAAKLSPLRWTSRLDDAQIEVLHDAVQNTLSRWTKLLSEEAEQQFPKKVTAFRPEMAVHGKYKQACPVCDSPVQRIQYANNETNYCPTCQTDGKLLADRSLSRLLKKDWPKTLEELEVLRSK